MHAKWYVYTLVDPRDGNVFYVGKGCGKRVHAHERDALKASEWSRKVSRIREIWSFDMDVEHGFSAYFWDEQAAYDHETDLIDEIGLCNLTNVLPGGQKAWERRRVERAERKRRERPPEPLHVVLKRIGPVFYDRLSEWLRVGGHKGATFKFTVVDPAYKWHAAISEACYNKLLPMFWENICKDERAASVAQGRLRSHGVELTFVPA